MVAHLLKSIGVLSSKVISDEVMPADFLPQRIDNYIDGKDPFGPVIHYSQKRNFN